MLSPEQAIWAADQFIDYYSKFNRIDDYLRFVKNSRIMDSSGKLLVTFSINNDFEFSRNSIAELYDTCRFCCPRKLPFNRQWQD